MTSKRTELVKLPKEIESLGLTEEQKAVVLKAVNEGKEISVSEGKVLVKTHIPRGEIEGWEVGETIQGILIDIKDSSQYPNNRLGSFLLANKSIIVKPLNKLLEDTISSTLKIRGLNAVPVIWTITAKEKVITKDGTRSYYVFDISYDEPLF